MSKEWNNCKLIYDGKEFNENFDINLMSSWMSYIDVVGFTPTETVWYDTIEQRCFGSELNFYNSPNEFSFFSKREKFLLNNEAWGLEHIKKNFSCVLGQNATFNDDYVLQRNENMEKYKDKTILVVGAGPTAEDVKWEQEEFDYIWSCTNFFKNQKLKEVGVDLATIGGNVSLVDEEFNEYLQNHKTLCGFECGVSPFKQLDEMLKFKKSYPDSVFYYHPRYFSKLGAAARLLCLGNFVEAKTVKFVGFDGNPVGQKHSFEGNNKVHDEAWRNKRSDNVYRRQLVLLWEYLFQNDTEYINLGQDHPANQSTDIFRKEKK